MANGSLRILAPTRYPWRFNSPRKSRHLITNKPFVPFNRVSARFEGITAFPRLPGQSYDLIHAFNRIPIERTPFIIGFESHLPRGFGMESTTYFRWMTDRLASGQCRAIIAISDFARRMFLSQHAGSAMLPVLSRKLEMHYPSIDIPPEPHTDMRLDLPMRLLFVGNHFARKGGLVALRLAELALENDLPLHINIVSGLEYGTASWTDPTRPGYYEHYLKLLQLPNVKRHGELKNTEALALMRNNHFTLLPTFSDTFGYSVIESMANGTPVIGTTQGALPEMILDGQNGLMLNLPTTPQGEWLHIGRQDRDKKAYEEIHRQAVEALAQQCLLKLQSLMGDDEGYSKLRQGARRTAEDMFSSARANAYWDDLYDKAVRGADLPSAMAAGY
jgi:glycosyltransferase involved in cell wall biosynthesis